MSVAVLEARQRVYGEGLVGVDAPSNGMHFDDQENDEYIEESF